MEQLADVRERLDVAAALEDGLGDARTALEMIADDPSSADVPELASEVSDAVVALEAALETWERGGSSAGRTTRSARRCSYTPAAAASDAHDWAERLESVLPRSGRSDEGSPSASRRGRPGTRPARSP